MTPRFAIRRVTLDQPGIEPLRREAAAAGLKLVDRLVDGWTSGANRFDKAGELLAGAYHGDDLVAVGGLARDPYDPAPRRARLRHLYVLRAWRRQGVANALIEYLRTAADGSFDEIRLRTHSDDAAHFYEALGFRPIASPTATHVLDLP